MEVDQIILHNKYNDVTLENDIALLKLKDSLEYGSTVQEIPFATDQQSSEYFADKDEGLTQPGSGVWVSGWGDTDIDPSGQEFPDRLQAVRVSVIKHRRAITLYEKLGEDPNNIPDTMLAAGRIKGGKDSCQGDSGGPLVAKKDGKKVLVGIVSWGYGCAEAKTPGWYTRVSSYHDWIDNKMN